MNKRFFLKKNDKKIEGRKSNHLYHSPNLVRIEKKLKGKKPKGENIGEKKLEKIFFELII